MNMVIGNGVIANRFINYSAQKDYLIFAGSGDNSVAGDEEEEATIQHALSQSSEATVVYFSTCSILDERKNNTAHVQHKMRMEQLIQDSAKKYLILRLPQILGLSNTKSSLVDFLVDSIHDNKPFDLWQHAEENIIDIDDVHAIVAEILKTKIYLNKVINVANKNKVSILEIIHNIEIFLGKKADYQVVDEGSKIDIDISEIRPITAKLKIDFNENYINNSLKKYFGHLIAPPKLISIIVPTFNNEDGINEFYRRTKAVLNLLAPRFDHEIIFVNDFSSDKTAQEIEYLAQVDPEVKLINFSRNFGNQIGITAGIDYSHGDIAVVIDDDLQDPPEI